MGFSANKRHELVEHVLVGCAQSVHYHMEEHNCGICHKAYAYRKSFPTHLNTAHKFTDSEKEATDSTHMSNDTNLSNALGKGDEHDGTAQKLQEKAKRDNDSKV